MRLIADADLERLRHARRYSDCDSVAAVTLYTVLENIYTLGHEQFGQSPKIVELPPEELRRMYPERYSGKKPQEAL